MCCTFGIPPETSVRSKQRNSQVRHFLSASARSPRQPPRSVWCGVQCPLLPCLKSSWRLRRLLVHHVMHQVALQLFFFWMQSHSSLQPNRLGLTGAGGCALVLSPSAGGVLEKQWNNSVAVSFGCSGFGSRSTGKGLMCDCHRVFCALIIARRWSGRCHRVFCRPNQEKQAADLLAEKGNLQLDSGSSEVPIRNYSCSLWL